MSFSVTFPHEEPLLFANAAEVLKWADKEAAFWNRYREAAGKMSISEALNLGQIDSALARVRKAVERDPAQIQDALNRVPTHVDITTRHPLAAYMAQLSDAGQHPQTVLLVYVLNKSEETFRLVMLTQSGMPHAFLASYLLTSFRRQETPPSYEAFISEFKAYKVETAETLRAAQAMLGQLESDRETWIGEAKNTRESHEAMFDAALEVFQKDLIQTKEKYDKQFALQAPIAYWTSKAERHEKAASKNRLWFYILLVASLVASGLLAWGWLLERLSRNPDNFWPVVVFSAFVAALAWPVRLLAKFWLSQSHLYEDASERAVIAQTFLSLADNRTVEMSADDRKILLSALFRDTTAGLVKDDHPVNVMDAIANAIGRK